MGELNRSNIPSFNELSINKLWSHFKSNSTLMKYMPEYASKQLPEKEFFFNVLNTLYPVEVEKMVDAAYKARKTHYKRNEDELIELSSEMKQAIQSAIVYKSKMIFYFIIHSDAWKGFIFSQSKMHKHEANEGKYEIPCRSE